MDVHGFIQCPTEDGVEARRVYCMHVRVKRLVKIETRVEPLSVKFQSKLFSKRVADEIPRSLSLSAFVNSSSRIFTFLPRVIM